MLTNNLSTKRILLHLLRDFSSMHTITSIAKELGLSRVGIWKILKKLEEENYISLQPIGEGKTSTSIAKINWKNPLIDKALSFYLAEEALKHRRWQVDFLEFEGIVDFVILYGSILHSPREAGDIDILGIAAKKNFVKLQIALDKAQKTQSKKIHAINFTGEEFKAELKKQNKAFINAIRKGFILFGQEAFVKFMKEVTK